MKELIYRTNYAKMKEAKIGVFRYAESFSNRKSQHSSPGSTKEPLTAGEIFAA